VGVSKEVTSLMLDFLLLSVRC